MKNILSIKSFTTKKQYDRIVRDLENIIHILDLTRKSLMFFKQYSNVQNLISDIETNLNILTAHRNKYINELAKVEKEYSE